MTNTMTAGVFIFQAEERSYRQQVCLICSKNVTCCVRQYVSIVSFYELLNDTCPSP